MKHTLLPYCSIAFLFALASSAHAGVIPSGRTVAPSGFEENKGQVLTTAGDAAPFVRYRLTQGNTSIFLLRTGIAYQFNRLHYPAGYEALEKDAHLDPTKQQELDSLRKDIRMETYRMDALLEGANVDASITTEGRSDDYTQYYNHNALDVHTYSRVTYHDVYPGIDWVVYTTEKGLEYDFVLRPGADPAKIQLRFKDQEELYVDADGQLIQGNRMGRFTEEQPVSSQNGKTVDSRFVLDGDRLSFSIGEYDHSQALIIDPNRIWATYFGGAGDEETWSCAADSMGNAYLAGYTNSTTAIASGGYQNSYGGGDYDAFLVKFNSNGVRQWATYYGGSASDWGDGCVADGNGNVYLAGSTESDTGIAFEGHQNTFGESIDAFLVKFNSSGVRQWATYYGGMQNTYSSSCAMDHSGNVYLAGSTESDTGIAYNGHQSTLVYWGIDAFLVKFDSSGVRQWGTYYGGGSTQGHFCAVDGNDNVYLTGHTVAGDDIASGGFQNVFGGGIWWNNDAFLVKFDANGVRQWGTYYGDDGDDYGWSCAADGNGNVYMAGETSSDSVIASGGFQNTLLGEGSNAFLAKFDASGARQWATYYGGVDGAGGFSCAVDDSDNVYLAGATNSIAQIASEGYQNTNNGLGDSYLVKFNASGARQWGTYYGGTSAENTYCCTVDDSGHVYLEGITISIAGIANGGDQNTYGGGGDGFLVKFDGLSGSNAGILSPEDLPSSFSIWPNPNAGDRLFLQTQGTGPAEVQLFDDLGQLQRTWHLQLSPGQAPVELKIGSDLSKGMYMVHCTVGGRSGSSPLVVQ